MAKDEMTVFVKIQEYKDIIEVLNLAKSKVKQAKFIINKIEELKKQEDSEVENWKSKIADVEESIQRIDSTLLEPEV